MFWKVKIKYEYDLDRYKKAVERENIEIINGQENKLTNVEA